MAEFSDNYERGLQGDEEEGIAVLRTILVDTAADYTVRPEQFDIVFIFLRVCLLQKQYNIPKTLNLALNP